MRIRNVGILLRVHRREQYLGRIFEQIETISRRLLARVHISIMADRPSAAVVCKLNYLIGKFRPRITVSNNVAPLPVLSVQHGQKWIENLIVHYEKLLDIAPDIEAGMLWDDDTLFTYSGLVELCGHMKFMTVDHIEGETLFLWDEDATYNARFPEHLQTVAFKVLRDDRFVPDIARHAPARVSASQSVTRLVHPLLSYGLLTEDERRTSFDVSCRAGRLDAFTLAFIEDPNIKKVENYGAVAK